MKGGFLLAAGLLLAATAVAGVASADPVPVPGLCTVDTGDVNTVVSCTTRAVDHLVATANACLSGGVQGSLGIGFEFGIPPTITLSTPTVSLNPECFVPPL